MSTITVEAGDVDVGRACAGERCRAGHRKGTEEISGRIDVAGMVHVNATAVVMACRAAERLGPNGAASRPVLRDERIASVQANEYPRTEVDAVLEISSEHQSGVR